MNSNLKQKLDKDAAHPLQTSAWGDFRNAWGNTSKIVEYKEGHSKKYLQVVFSKVPHTPFNIGVVFKGPAPTQEMFLELKKIGEAKNAIFIKLEPNILEDRLDKRIKGLILRECKRGKRFFTPETFYIDLTKSEDELMNGFASKTRYNIRLATRRGVKVKEDNSQKAFNTYLKLTLETASRQGFYAHSKKYHEIMWENLHTKQIRSNKKPIARLLTASYNGEILATWVVFVWKDFLYYPYGASSDKHKEVMANNLMMWESIKYGKSLGLTTFDLWGKEEGKGFTRFKEGYNPKVVKFIGSWDYVLNKQIYPVYKIAEAFRWFILKKVLTIFR